MPSRFPSLSRLSVVVGLISLVLLTGCSVEVAGYESSSNQDPEPMRWLPLEDVVRQPFLHGPGWSAAVGTDRESTPAVFQEQMAALPKEANSGSLESLRVGLRLEPGKIGPWETDGRVQIVYAPENDLRFPERDFIVWDETNVWVPAQVGLIAGQTFVSPYPGLAGVLVRIGTFGGDLSPGEAVIGEDGVEVLTLPDNGEFVATLSRGTRVHVSGSAEGWANVTMRDGQSGWVALEQFSRLPPPAQRPSRALRFELHDSDGTLLRTVEIPPDQLHDHSHLLFEFEPLPDSQDRSYTFFLSVSDEPGHPGVTVLATGDDHYAEGTRLDANGPTGNDLVFRPHYVETQPLLDVGIDTLPRESIWLQIDNPPDIPEGLLVAVQLVPGQGPDAGMLRFGVTSGRVPLGGWQAVDSMGTRLGGAVLVQTRYARSIGVGWILTDSARRLRAAAANDPAFAAVYLFGLASLMAVAFGAAWPRRKEPDQSS